MPFNYEIPRIDAPDYQAPESVSPVYDSVSWTDGRTAIQKGHYWKRIYGTVVRCGQEFTAKISTKVGVSHSVIQETSNSLDLSISFLKATLGDKVSHTDLLSREDTIEMSRKVVAKECDAVTFAEWQRCDRFEITRFGRMFSRTRTHTLDIPLNDTYPDSLEYSDPGCCPAKFDDKVKQGYAEVYSVQLEEVTYAVLAKVLANGKIQLNGLEGMFTPGQIIRTLDFPTFFRGRDEVAVIGRHSMGTVQHFYRKKLTVESSSAPNGTGISNLLWFLTGIGASLALLNWARAGKSVDVNSQKTAAPRTRRRVKREVYSYERASTEERGIPHAPPAS